MPSRTIRYEHAGKLLRVCLRLPVGEDSIEAPEHERSRPNGHNWLPNAGLLLDQPPPFEFVNDSPSGGIVQPDARAEIPKVQIRVSVARF